MIISIHEVSLLIGIVNVSEFYRIHLKNIIKRLKSKNIKKYLNI